MVVIKTPVQNGDTYARPIIIIPDINHVQVVFAGRCILKMPLRGKKRIIGNKGHGKSNLKIFSAGGAKKNNIEHFGCHVLKVMEGEDAPEFTYSIGINKKQKKYKE